MKITKQLLREIIKEEINKVLLNEISNGKSELTAMHPEIVEFLDVLIYEPERSGIAPEKLNQILAEIKHHLSLLEANIKPGKYLHDKRPANAIELAALRSAAILGVIKRAKTTK